MGVFRSNCPHCTTADLALDIAHVYAHAKNKNVMSVFLKCPRCDMPSLAVLHNTEPSPPWQNGTILAGDPQTQGWKMFHFWPAQTGPDIPEQLPKEIERIYLQAERNFPVAGSEEAAGMMYRKALDVGLKKIDATLTGTLAARIKKLAANGKITVDIAEWSDHVRDMGNEAAHEEEPPTREELTDLRNFTEMVMRYLFSLPALVLARKPKPPAGG